jgi:hypothetical protein
MFCFFAGGKLKLQAEGDLTEANQKIQAEGDSPRQTIIKYFIIIYAIDKFETIQESHRSLPNRQGWFSTAVNSPFLLTAS